MSLRDDLDYDSRDDAYDYPPERPGRQRRRLLPLLLAGGGIALFSGIIWYAYTAGKQATVGPDGVTPLIQASPAPTKQRPDQPGGMEVPHQDKLVYDRLTPDASAAAPAVERLLPPPEAPVPRPVLTPQQQVAQLQQQLQAPSPGMAGMQGMQGMQGMALPSAPTAPPQPPAMTGNQAAALPPVPATTPEPRPAGPPRVAPPPAKPPAAEAKPAPAKPPAAEAKPAPAKPPAPEAKPVPAKPPAAEAKPAPAKPAATSGGFRVQLASVRTEEEAQAEWKRFQTRHKGQLGNLNLVVKKTDLGEKGTYYRVQGGAVDEARAKAICAELKGQNVGCQVVKP